MPTGLAVHQHRKTALPSTFGTIQMVLICISMIRGVRHAVEARWRGVSGLNIPSSPHTEFLGDTELRHLDPQQRSTSPVDGHVLIFSSLASYGLAISDCHSGGPGGGSVGHLPILSLGGGHQIHPTRFIFWLAWADAQSVACRYGG